MSAILRATRPVCRRVELVRDKDNKTPFDPALKLHAAIKANCMARGLMVYPMGGTIDGQYGDHILIAPPFIITPAQIDFCGRYAEQRDPRRDGKIMIDRLPPRRNRNGTSGNVS